MTTIDFSSLETLIDQEGLYAVLDKIAEICHDKADHILSNYAEMHLSRAWDEAGDLISNIAARNRDL